MSRERELGTLVVVVLKARNLHDKHSFFKQDVYARVSLNGTTQNTPVDIKGGQHPVWDAEIRLPVLNNTGEKYRMLEVSCWAKENKEDDLKGTGKIDISETLRTGEFDDWVGLDTNGVSRGEVYLEMTYYAAAPVPLTRRPSKLNPYERVARLPPKTPPKTSASTPPFRSPVPLRELATSPKSSQLFPPSPRCSPSPSPSSSPRARERLLPALPEEPLSDKHLKPVPTILRPGRPQSSPTPIPHPLLPGHARYPSNSPPPDYGRLHPNPAYSLPPRPAYQPATTPESLRMKSLPGGYFPAQAIPSIREPSGDNLSYGTLAPVGHDFDLPDPFLSSRYTAPLPLPCSPPRNDQGRSSTINYNAPPLPVHHQPPPYNSQDELRRRTLLAEEEEEEVVVVARRKAQEERDLELARQLDRELNLDELESERAPESRSGGGNWGGGSDPGMPGGW